MNVDTRYSVGMPSILCVSLSVRQINSVHELSFCPSLVRLVALEMASKLGQEVRRRSQTHQACFLIIPVVLRNGVSRISAFIRDALILELQLQARFRNAGTASSESVAVASDIVAYDSSILVI